MVGYTLTHILLFCKKDSNKPRCLLCCLIGGVGFYGPGQHYSILAGVDATRVLGKMNMSEVIDRCTYPVVPLVLCEDGSGPAADADSVSAVDDEGGVSQTDAQVKTCTPIVKKRHSNPLRDYSDFTSQQLKDLNRWVHLLVKAKKYPVVGTLVCP